MFQKLQAEVLGSKLPVHNTNKRSHHDCEKVVNDLAPCVAVHLSLFDHQIVWKVGVKVPTPECVLHKR